MDRLSEKEILDFLELHLQCPIVNADGSLTYSLNTGIHTIYIISQKLTTEINDRN
jgi:hypothetical protein